MEIKLKEKGYLKTDTTRLKDKTTLSFINYQMESPVQTTKGNQEKQLHQTKRNKSLEDKSKEKETKEGKQNRYIKNINYMYHEYLK